jgi:hypothetical protein
MRLRSVLFRRSAEIVVLVLLCPFVGCGSSFLVAGAIHPSNVIVSTGTVSFVALSVVSGSNGTFVNVTGVTLLVPMGSSSLTFCGDQRSNFPMNSVVQVSFTDGQNCSSLVNVSPVATVKG